MLTIFVLFILNISPIISLSSDEWHSKSQCTQKEFANHMDITCNSNEYILIGWSHYGTKKSAGGLRSLIKSNQQRCEPSESDCIMDYTHKIAELCNGVSKCEVILTQQFIHKCSDEATYLFISYQCINNSTIVDVCSQRSLSSSNGLNLISPTFPNEYPNNVNCTCLIEPTEITQQTSPILIDVESLSFNLQDNDYLSSSKSSSFSGTLPFGASLFNEKDSVRLTFTTDETLSQSGFWIRLHGYHQCRHDEYSIGSKCLKIFQDKQTWPLAQEKCLSIGSRLIQLNDIVQEKKLAHFISNSSEQQTSFWISDDKQNLNIHSWWPWRSSINEGNCVLRTQDGWLKRPCDEYQSFICERDIHRQSVPLTVRCGNAKAPLTTTISSTTTTITTTTTVKTTTMSSTRRPTVPFIQPPVENNEILSMSKQEIYEPAAPMEFEQDQTTIETKTNSIDPNILAAILGGVAIAIFVVNIIVCYICKRRTQKSSKCKTPNESQSSFTHEELQRSLMQHLYHEQTNTISSTSTSSSSSKHSQSKSNDTSTTTATTTPANANLLQLCSPPNASHSYITRTNAPATALCFRNPHAGLHTTNETVDYHVYETIPSENINYNLCPTHSAFKPVVQTNTHTIRPFLPRTNILYHPPGSSKQSYDTSTLTTATTSAVLMPVCCHHHLPQCPTGTLRQHVSPCIIPPPPPPPQMATQEQIYIGSESIV